MEGRAAREGIEVGEPIPTVATRGVAFGFRSVFTAFFTFITFPTFSIFSPHTSKYIQNSNGCGRACKAATSFSRLY